MSVAPRLITTRSLIADFEQIGLHAGQVMLAHTSIKMCDTIRLED